jgi:hypothetical protein
VESGDEDEGIAVGNAGLKTTLELPVSVIDEDENTGTTGGASRHEEVW